MTIPKYPRADDLSPQLGKSFMRTTGKRSIVVPENVTVKVMVYPLTAATTPHNEISVSKVKRIGMPKNGRNQPLNEFKATGKLAKRME